MSLYVCPYTYVLIRMCRGEAHRKLLDVLNYSNVSKLCSLKGIGKQVGCPLLCVCVCVCMRVCAFVHECVCVCVCVCV